MTNSKNGEKFPSPSRKPAAQFSQAQQHHQAGLLGDAENCYRQILAETPDHPGALHGIGLIAYQLGQGEAAIEFIQRAIRQAPNNPTFLRDLASALSAKGRSTAAPNVPPSSLPHQLTAITYR